jgi:hypothetical protein
MRLAVQIRRENNRNYVQIQSNDYEKIEKALEEQLGINCGRWGLDPSDEQKLKYALQKFFENHSQFYDYFGFDAGVEHGPTGQDFNTGGWRQFVQDAFNTNRVKYITNDEDLQLFSDVIAKRLKEALDNYDDELLSDEENFVAQSSVTVDAEPSGTLTDPEMLDEALVVTNDGAKKLQVQDVEGAETLDDVKEQVEEDTKEVYENQVDARVETLKARNQRLEDKIESERKEMLVKGIQMVGNLEDWKVEGDYLKYKKTVNMETVKLKDHDEPRELTEEAQEKFYIDGVKIPIKKKIKKVRYEDAYHPHALSYGTCTGSFRAEMGEEGLREAIDQLKHGDLHGRNHTESERDLKNNWEDYVKTETVENEDGEEEEQEVTEEVWTAE